MLPLIDADTAAVHQYITKVGPGLRMFENVMNIALEGTRYMCERHACYLSFDYMKSRIITNTIRYWKLQEVCPKVN